MTTSSTRFIIIALMTWILLGMLWVMMGNFSDNNPSYQSGIYSSSIENLSKEGNDIFGDQNLDESQTVLNREFGNPIGFGKFLWSVLNRQITKDLMGYTQGGQYINCPDCPDETTGNILGYFFMTFFAIVNFLAVWELFQIFILKKQS